MRPPAEGARRDLDACWGCRRRSWLLGNLSPLLDYHRGDPARLGALLELPDSQLIDALAGRRRETLRNAMAALVPRDIRGATTGAVCPHTPRWAGCLAEVAAGGMLWLSSPPHRLRRLLEAPRVAIMGPGQASVYATDVAGGLARGLSVAGVTIIAGLAGELALAVHGAVEETGAGSIGIAGDGLDRIAPAGAARLARQLGRRGCLASGLPLGTSGRGWGRVAATGTMVALADVVIVVEADAAIGDAARRAVALGRALGAVPGPVTSRLSVGSHALIREGAELIGDAQDVLDLLYRAGDGADGRSPRVLRPPPVPPELAAVLERVGAGEDRPEQLIRGAPGAGSIMAALGELEAMGLLARRPGGRYVVTGPTPMLALGS